MKPTNVEFFMAVNAEATNKYLEGIKLLLEQLLDKFSGLESWKTTADSSLGSLLQTTAGRVQKLEARPPPLPLPSATMLQPRPQQQW